MFTCWWAFHVVFNVVTADALKNKVGYSSTYMLEATVNIDFEISTAGGPFC